MPLMGLQFPANRVSGRFKGNSNVNSWNRGQQILRSVGDTPNPDTPDQQAVRGAMSLLTKNWKTLSDSVTDDWDAFATENPITNRLGNRVSRTGLSAYLELGSIHYFRTGTLLSAAPTLGRPSPPSLLTVTGGQTPGDLALEVTHAFSSITGLYWMVRMTDALPSIKVTPNLSLYRMVKGVGSGSFTAVAASVDSVTFTSTKYDLTDLDWFGVEIQTVNAEGWTSTPVRVQSLFQV